MKEYSTILAAYSPKEYSMYSNTISAAEWGNQQVANKYLEKYWLPLQEYEYTWKECLNRVFLKDTTGFPNFVFKPEYEIQTTKGGCLFVKEEFVKFQTCTRKIGEKFLFIVENTFEGRVKDPVFRMKFPATISWEQLTGGNFVSSILLEMPHKEYFVFSESSLWGKYSANDFKLPLDILGFKSEVAAIFKSEFKLSETERAEISRYFSSKDK